MKKNTDLKAIMVTKYGAYCYECNFHAGYPSAKQLDLHHALIHDQNRYHDILTVEENCVLVCRDCHPYTNGHEFRMKVLGRKVMDLGIDRMRSWWEGIPEKLKRGSDYVWISETLESRNNLYTEEELK